MVKWQTRYFQAVVSASSCEFKSRRPHQLHKQRQMMNGADIFKFLCGLKLEFSEFDWLENRGLSEFELLISVILTQNTSWNNVLKALNNVRVAKIQSLEALNALETQQIATLIKPSGFYNQKAKRLKGFVGALLSEFGDMGEFKARVSRQWLLNVKGLGFESADSILNYLCQREILVVDSYTNRLAYALGYEFESYDELREFFQSGIESEQKAINACLGEFFKDKNTIFTDEKGENSSTSNEKLNLNSTNSSTSDKNLNSHGENSNTNNKNSQKNNENLSKCDKNSSAKNKNANLNSTNSSQNLVLYELYQIFHAQIIAFGKAYFKGKTLNDEGKRVLKYLQR